MECDELRRAVYDESIDIRPIVEHVESCEECLAWFLAERRRKHAEMAALHSVAPYHRNHLVNDAANS